MEHQRLVQAVASGSWMRVHARDVGGVASNAADGRVEKEEVTCIQNTLHWFSRGTTVCQLTCRQWALLGVILLVIATVFTIVLLEALEIINLIPPTFSPPPSPPQFPPSPGGPPLPTAPPMPPTAPPPPLPPPLSPNVGVMARHTCSHTIDGLIVLLANNGRCEDGGFGSLSSMCELGHDYPDCPERYQNKTAV